VANPPAHPIVHLTSSIPMSRPTLDAVEVRAVFALAEKSMATPDQYPMTLHALVAACNQKTAREPVTALAERDVQAALERLMRRGLVGTTAGAGHRVAKFRHRLDQALDLSKRELAALTLLALRGPQTSGEIRTRSERLAAFESVEAAEEALWLLADRDDPLVVRLPRRPGQSADRYAHLLSGDVDAEAWAEAPSSSAASAAASPAASPPSALVARVEALEAEVADLRARLDALIAELS